MNEVALRADPDAPPPSNRFECIGRRAGDIGLPFFTLLVIAFIAFSYDNRLVRDGVASVSLEQSAQTPVAVSITGSVPFVPDATGRRLAAAVFDVATTVSSCGGWSTTGGYVVNTARSVPALVNSTGHLTLGTIYMPTSCTFNLAITGCMSSVCYAATATGFQTPSGGGSASVDLTFATTVDMSQNAPETVEMQTMLSFDSSDWWGIYVDGYENYKIELRVDDDGTGLMALSTIQDPQSSGFSFSLTLASDSPMNSIVLDLYLVPPDGDPYFTAPILVAQAALEEASPGQLVGFLAPFTAEVAITGTTENAITEMTVDYTLPELLLTRVDALNVQLLDYSSTSLVRANVTVFNPTEPQHLRELTDQPLVQLPSGDWAVRAGPLNYTDVPITMMSTLSVDITVKVASSGNWLSLASTSDSIQATPPGPMVPASAYSMSSPLVWNLNYYEDITLGSLMRLPLTVYVTNIDKDGFDPMEMYPLQGAVGYVRVSGGGAWTMANETLTTSAFNAIGSTPSAATDSAGEMIFLVTDAVSAWAAGTPYPDSTASMEVGVACSPLTACEIMNGPFSTHFNATQVGTACTSRWSPEIAAMSFLALTSSYTSLTLNYDEMGNSVDCVPNV